MIICKSQVKGLNMNVKKSEMTQPSEKSVILDVGSGTGHLVAGLVHSDTMHMVLKIQSNDRKIKIYVFISHST